MPRCQMSRLYSAMVRSEENMPALAMFTRHFFAPAHWIAGVIAENLPFAHHVGVEIRQGLEPVFADQFVMQAGQIFGMTGGQHLRPGEKVDGAAEIGIALVPLGSDIIADGVTVDDLIRGLAPGRPAVPSDEKPVLPAAKKSAGCFFLPAFQSSHRCPETPTAAERRAPVRHWFCRIP